MKAETPEEKAKVNEAQRREQRARQVERKDEASTPEGADIAKGRPSHASE